MRYAYHPLSAHRYCQAETSLYTSLPNFSLPVPLSSLPCLDVAIQRPLKLSLKRSAHVDIVAEVTAQLEKNADPQTIKLDTTIGVLRDCSVAWLVKAFNAINNRDLILNVCFCFFSPVLNDMSRCRVGKYNCLHECLTLSSVLSDLVQLLKTNP